ncbi:hypothetical protein [Bacillus sp. D386]|uniref:hypothetical protein n=1 Tax=Bacillus sp. D386 TaxID=2587155 RepID=UPI00111D3175|nr:hypothetical protein [Bacillus sp. D386]
MKIEESESPLDIVINYEDLADEWNCAEEKEKGYWVRDNRVLFEIDQVAIFAVDSGKTISISPHLDSDLCVGDMYGSYFDAASFVAFPWECHRTGW